MKISDLLRDFADTHLLRGIADTIDQQEEDKSDDKEVAPVTAAAATAEIDYPLNFALPPGYRILVGLGTTVAAGWLVTGFGGAY